MAHRPVPATCTTRHAVILAAGESKRTRPLTSHRPKPLIPLLGRPLLAHILDELVGLVDHATLVIGYRADAIRHAFGASYRGIALHYVLQTEVNGTAGALRAVGPLAEPFFLLYGDNLIAHADLVGVCASLPSLAGLRVEDARSFGVLQIEDGHVRGIWEKPEHPPPDALANPGIYHLDAAAFPALEQIQPSPRGEYELTDLIGLLAAQRPVGYHICTGFWVPIGTPWEALSAVQFLLARRAGLASQIDPQAHIEPGVQISGWVQIGRARVGAGSRIIGPAVIGDDCVIGAGCRVETSCMEPGAHVDDGARVHDSVIGAGAHVGAGSRVESSWLDDLASVAPISRLPSQHFTNLRPTAATAGLLTPTQLCTRGVILSREVHVNGTVDAGRVV
ncbi:nucleotidyl transferase [Oscillochloris trichoides DG-6]|uniref:Nucleotidyl transferase n=1 Tax=Oscillochloris trichoides DG-6 TaxID=765420 RepID=E1IIB2_9CHLR|nr:sugar phosphate nucleotidyltransferase [Oscillochloris trichoides]EFO79062.1 nucleotidyl transferase [Oscillochloris trichoides DG-6]